MKLAHSARTVLCLAAFSIGVAGCADGSSTAFVTVHGTVANVDHFIVTVSNAGQTSEPQTVALTGRPVSLPPDRTFSLEFGKSRSGSVTVDVDVYDAANTKLTSGSGTGTISPSHSTAILVTLGTSVLPDMGTGDLSVDDMVKSGDQLSSNEDLSSPPDLIHSKYQGDACVVGVDTCDTGHCVDGYCCNSDCTDGCGACDVSSHLGTCTPVSGPPHGARSCDGTGTCGGTCNGTVTSCTYPSSSVVCGASCNGTCNGAGTCSSTGGAGCPNGYACGNSACLTSCSKPADCQQPNFTCSGSSCVRVAESDCLDGKDNNGDGLVDCADPTCTTVECVPNAGGDDIGYLNSSGCTDPNYATATSLHQNLSSVSCTGCGCNYDGSCSGSATIYTSSDCSTGGATVSIQDFGGNAAGTCVAVPAKVYQSAKVSLDLTNPHCSITTQATAATPTWGVSTNFCVARQSPSSLACPAAQVCVAKSTNAPKVCARVPSGGCPGGYSQESGTYYSSYTPGSCNSCGCTPTATATCPSGAGPSGSGWGGETGSGTCVGGVANGNNADGLYLADGTCTTQYTGFGGFSPTAMSSYTTFAIFLSSSAAGTCTSSATVADQPQPTGASTICCQP